MKTLINSRINEVERLAIRLSIMSRAPRLREDMYENKDRRKLQKQHCRGGSDTEDSESKEIS